MHNPTYTADDDRWLALVARDARADGTFVYAVKTTGVYCRPCCKSRRPNRGNVEFFATWQEAEHAGFRACRRCGPRGDESPGHREAVVAACRRIERATKAPGLRELAEGAGLSACHFQRVFKRVVGVTPKQYGAGLRAKRFGQALGEGKSVTRAIHAAGYGSSSRCYEAAAETLGMAPSRYRRGGEGIRIRVAVRRCSLGCVLVAATDQGICAIELGENEGALRETLRRRFVRAQIAEADAQLAGDVEKVVALVERPGSNVDLPLDIRGTAFQQRVWAALREIRPGTTVTYGEIARRIGVAGAVRAVARACGANVLAVAVPCHRVVRGDGGLGGYRWGLERKQALLAREGKRSH